MYNNSRFKPVQTFEEAQRANEERINSIFNADSGPRMQQMRLESLITGGKRLDGEAGEMQKEYFNDLIRRWRSGQKLTMKEQQDATQWMNGVYDGADPRRTV